MKSLLFNYIKSPLLDYIKSPLFNYIERPLSVLRNECERYHVALKRPLGDELPPGLEASTGVRGGTRVLVPWYEGCTRVLVPGYKGGISNGVRRGAGTLVPGYEGISTRVRGY